jgi:hypothetical protein
MSTANPAAKKAKSSKSPPEETFWKRYSPHHEFPLSTVMSVSMHVLSLVLLFLAVRWLIHSDKGRPLQEIGVIIAPGGGGGNPQGVGKGPGGELKSPDQENVDTSAENSNTPPPPERTQPELAPSKPEAIFPTVQDQGVRELLKSSNDAVRAQAHVADSVREKLRRGLMPGQGQGGPGSGGGKDRGTDTGIGRDTGPGTGNMNERLKRTLRWVMVFDTFNGEDYARQLAGLGAILAFPRSKDQYLVVRDLNTRPARGHVEDIEKIKRIYWVDDKRESITPLCLALGVKPVPDHVVAFFPEKLEKKLLELELKYKGRKESEIYETRFKIVKSASGYDPVVIDQKAN